MRRGSAVLALSKLHPPIFGHNAVSPALLSGYAQTQLLSPPFGKPSLTNPDLHLAIQTVAAGAGLAQAKVTDSEVCAVSSPVHGAGCRQPGLPSRG